MNVQRTPKYVFSAHHHNPPLSQNRFTKPITTATTSLMILYTIQNINLIEPITYKIESIICKMTKNDVSIRTTIRKRNYLNIHLNVFEMEYESKSEFKLNTSNTNNQLTNRPYMMNCPSLNLSS